MKLIVLILMFAAGYYIGRIEINFSDWKRGFEEANKRKKLEKEIDRLQEMCSAYKKQIEGQWEIVTRQKQQIEFYKNQIEEIGAEIEIETCRHFDPIRDTGFRELQRVRVHYDKIFMLEGCDRYYEKIDELDGRLEYLEGRSKYGSTKSEEEKE